jgi:hypothetical protein
MEGLAADPFLNSLSGQHAGTTQSRALAGNAAPAPNVQHLHHQQVSDTLPHS